MNDCDISSFFQSLMHSNDCIEIQDVHIALWRCETLHSLEIQFLSEMPL